MRDLKFRAWLPERKVMGLVTEISLRNDDYLPTKVQVEYHYELGDNSYGLNKTQQQFTSTTDFELMQYTGLKDKNGVEIYEGDIVFMHYFEEYRGLSGASEEDVTVCGVIEYRPDFAVYVVKLPDRDLVINDYCQEPSEELQVIGNIYENSELLESK